MKMFKRKKEEPEKEFVSYGADQVKKEQEEKKHSVKITQDKPNQYQIVMRVPLGHNGFLKDLPPFDCYEESDDDGARFLVNDEYGFREPLPTTTEDYKLYQTDTLEKEIKKLEADIINPEIQNNPKINYLTLKQKLNKYKLMLSSLRMGDDGSYVSVSASNKLRYIFQRIGSLKFAQFDHAHKLATEIPSANRIKQVSELHTANKERHSKHKKTAIMATSVILFLAILFCCAALFGMIKSYDSYSESAAQQLNGQIDEMTIFCAEKYTESAENFLKASQNAVNITKSALDITQPPELTPNEVKTKK